MEAPRILLLAPHFPPEGGAASARMDAFARGLEALGHELRVVAPEPGYLVPAGAGDGSQVEGGPRVLRVPVRPRGHGAAANALHQARLLRGLRRGARRALAGFDADLVLVSTPPPLSALAGLRLRGGAGRRLPVVVDVRDVWPDVLVEAGALSPSSPTAWALRRLQQALLRGAAAVITVTQLKQRRLQARCGTTPVELVPNGVDSAWLAGPAHRGGGAGPDPFEVLHAGNVGRAQDVALLIRAVARLARPDPSRPVRGSVVRAVRACVVGEGQELDAVRGLAEGCGAPAEFHPPEPRTRVRQRLAGTGCAFVTLKTAQLADSVPSKLLDAMGAGVPVVLAASGEAADVLRASGGGVVVAPGDVDGLAGALADLAALPPSARVRMGEAGRRHVERHFRREDAVARLSVILHDVSRRCAAAT